MYCAHLTLQMFVGINCLVYVNVSLCMLNWFGLKAWAGWVWVVE